MIYSSINCNIDLPHYPQPIMTAIDYLKNNDFNKMEAGVYEIQGRDIYAQVFDKETKDAKDASPETHEKFIDVQFLANGKEKIGAANLNKNHKVKEHNKEKDLIFYEEFENEMFIEMNVGDFCVFFPDDVHRPAVANGAPMNIRKVVIKISVDLLK
ncbi:hypothetical protein AN639_01175 [Candidatus Epulonipiscium fishelsonii]|uniref:Uncharacterized protein n=1 Tax=Candidatus Epulonipiscium fishelsonii TaxID=77094 RepID=A0ACC8X7X6_9FIRM|nr:hypothetical protein AN396_12070 [Epulopiscium sp. SCG-B11WGA-EpuloA1]ONI40720.1 hypothetical protein AN639_01175 [Epulopiscium sp. SCG-B05WGA-EpuloA1]ONI47602.1 hypothetical protein AN644_04650 [Epulopiscium sp. SCG-C06WGA-EpuloA1]